MLIEEVIPELKNAEVLLLDAADLYIPIDAADKTDEAYEMLRAQVEMFMQGGNQIRGARRDITAR